MPATLSSVAAHAGVSTSTASRALSGHPAVLPSTRERVLAAAAELHYEPNRMASALRTNRSGLLGLVVDNLRAATSHVIAETLQAWAGEHGYQVLVCTTGGDPDRAAAFLQTVRTHHFDGVVVAGSGADAVLVDRLLDEGRAVVAVDQDVPGSRAPSVLADAHTASRLAAEHLLALGHTRIAAIEGPADVPSAGAHHAGLTAALDAAGVRLDAALVRRGAFDWSFGRDAAQSLLDLADPPTAMLVSNHQASFGVLPVLGARGLRLPDDLSLICTEDEPFFTWWSPPLSTVDSRAAEQARCAAELLLGQLSGDAPPPGTELVTPGLLVRGSTAAPPRPVGG